MKEQIIYFNLLWSIFTVLDMIGSTHVDSAVRLIMDSCLTDDMQTKFNLQGRLEKKIKLKQNWFQENSYLSEIVIIILLLSFDIQPYTKRAEIFIKVYEETKIVKMVWFEEQ